MCVHHGLGPAGIQTAVSHDAGGDPTSVAVADVTGDGKRDVLVVSNTLLRILPGNDDTSVGAPMDLALLAERHRHLATGDLNHDGIADIVVANEPGSISVFRGIGGGSFAARVDLASVGAVYDVAVADVGGDGFDDVIAVASGLSVFPGQAGTALGTRADYAPSGGWVAVGRLNGDLRADVAVLNGNGTVAVMMGQADGTLGAPVTVPIGSSSGGYGGLALADVEGDGDLDLVVARYMGGQFLIRVNDGAGNFSSAPNRRSSFRAAALAVGDVNGDGRPDLVTANSFPGCASVYLGDGAGGFPREAGYGASASPHAVAAGDLDGDGYDEIVTADALEGFSTGDGAPGWITVMRNVHGVRVGVSDPPLAPAATALAIMRAWPTVARSELHVAFVLPARGAATFELFDLCGRRLARESLGILSPGAQQRVARIGDAVPTGVIWLRLSQGASSAATKAIVAR